MKLAKHFNFALPGAALCSIVLAFTMTSAQAAITMSDSFESGDTNSRNANGFSWPYVDMTAVVTEKPKTGKYSLAFKYAPGEKWVEQTFDLGSAPQRELWVSYWIRVPDNYFHQAGADGRSNNKFLSIYMDGYEGKGDGSTFWLSMELAGGGKSDLAFTYSRGSHTGSLGYSQHKLFIDPQKDRGKWMQMVIHLKAQSAAGKKDGVIETWRRWETESKYTKFHEKFDAELKVPSGGPNGFKTGYLLGWANGYYRDQTNWYIDDFMTSTTSLLGNGSTSPQPAPEPIENAKPLPPRLTSN